MPRRAHVLLTVLTLLAPLAEVRAQGTAEEEFKKGQAAEAAGDLDVACAHYRAAVARDRKPGALQEAAHCDARDGRFLDALAKGEEALAPLPVGHPFRAEYEADIARWRASLAHLTLTLRAGASPPAVTLDGKPAPAWGQAQPLDPGRHLLVVQGDGAREEVVELAPGAAREITLPFAPGEFPPTPHDAADDGPWLVLAGVSFGIAGAGAISSIVTGVLVLDRDTEAESICASSGRAACDVAIDDATVLLAPNLASWIVMGVGLAAGLTFTIVEVSGDGAPATALTVGPGFLGMSRSF